MAPAISVFRAVPTYLHANTDENRSRYAFMAARARVRQRTIAVGGISSHLICPHSVNYNVYHRASPRVPPRTILPRDSPGVVHNCGVLDELKGVCHRRATALALRPLKQRKIQVICKPKL